MNVKVRLFARAKEIAGSDCVTVDVPDTAKVLDIRNALSTQFPDLSTLAPSLLISIGTDYADDTTSVPCGADVACFPPVSGG